MTRASFLVLSLAACTKPVPTLTVPVSITLGGAPWTCSTEAQVNGHSVTVSELGVFLHDLKWTTATGEQQAAVLIADERWQTDRVALLDFSDGTAHCEGGDPKTHTTLVFKDPGIPITGLSGAVGVPFDLNHSDPMKAKGPLSQTTMHWSWNAGYKFLRVDATVDGSPWSAHWGSTGCEGTVGAITGCKRPNRPIFALSGDPTGGVVFDLTPLFSQTQEGSCMGSPGASCQEVFTAFALDPQTGSPTGTMALLRSRTP